MALTIWMASSTNPCFSRIPAVISNVSRELGYFFRMLWANFRALSMVSSLNEYPYTNLFSIVMSKRLMQLAFSRFYTPYSIFPILSWRFPRNRNASAELNFVHFINVFSASENLYCFSKLHPILNKISSFSEVFLNILYIYKSF